MGKKKVYKVQGIDGVPSKVIVGKYKKLVDKLAVDSDVKAKMKMYGYSKEDVAFILATIMTNVPEALKQGYIVKLPKLVTMFSRRAIIHKDDE